MGHSSPSLLSRGRVFFYSKDVPFLPTRRRFEFKALKNGVRFEESVSGDEFRFFKVRLKKRIVRILEKKGNKMDVCTRWPLENNFNQNW